MDYETLVKTAYGDAVKKGFYSETIDNETLKGLIISEAYEALEAHRKGRLLLSVDVLKQYLLSDNQRIFENYIKDTLGDELADTSIRICSYVGYRKIEHKTGEFVFIGIREDSIGAMCNKIAEMILNNRYDECYFYIKRYCEVNHIPLEEHIKAKLKYNKTRPYKHGKQY